MIATELEVRMLHNNAVYHLMRGEKEAVVESAVRAEELINQIPVDFRKKNWKYIQWRQNILAAYSFYLAKEYEQCRDLIVPLIFEMWHNTETEKYMYEELSYARLLASSLFYAKNNIMLAPHILKDLLMTSLRWTARRGSITMNRFSCIKRRRNCFLN